MSIADFKSRLGSKGPIIIFVVFFGLAMALFYAVFLSDFFQRAIHTPYVNFNAAASNWLLNIFGQGTMVNADHITGSGFGVKVKGGCDGLEPTFLYLAAVAAFPIGWRLKMRGVIYGFLFLLGMNILRITTLFMTGVHARNLFDIMHVDVWQALFILLAVLTWVVWIRWALKKKAKNASE